MNDKILNEYKDFVWGKHSKYWTRKTYTDHPRIFLADIGKPLHEITKQDINIWVRQQYNRYKQNGNVVRFWSVRKFLIWAKKENLEEEIPKLSPEDAGKQALNDDDLEKLVNSVEQLSALHRLVLYLELDCLRRPSEIRNLKKNDRYGNILRYDGKTGIKTCVLSERCQLAWDEYIKIRPIPQTPEDEKFLILCDYGQYKGKRPKTPSLVDRIIKETCMYARVDLPQNENITNYLIKRTGITWQLKYGNDPKNVQQQAGHTKPETTMKYNRINEEHIKEHLCLWESKSAKVKEKYPISRDKSFLLINETPQTSNSKREIDFPENEDNSSFSFSFSLYILFRGKRLIGLPSINNDNCPQTEGKKIILFWRYPCVGLLQSYLEGHKHGCQTETGGIY